MSGRYERVNAHDDEADSPIETSRPTQLVPNSPPPSFHSRASSILSRDQRVDPDLADAFDSDDDESDDEADDRQRLVRGDSSSTLGGAAQAPVGSSTCVPGERREAQATAASTPPTASAQASRIYGGGIQSDGVFSNLTAKPERGGEEKEEQPPSYEQAAADAAPPYWETTILAPGLGGPDEVYIDGMPVGSFFSFIWNGMISMSFQLVGFLLTYLLHSTHAAKNGSRAGLGITLIQFGFSIKSASSSASSSSGSGMGGGQASGDGYSNPPDPNAHNFNPASVNQDDNNGGGISDIAGSDWAAYILMIVGWFILIRAVSDYLKARRHEQLVLQSPDRGLGVPIIAVGERSETVV